MKKYESLNGLRAFAAICILLMHVRANISIDVNGNFIYSHIIPQMSDFVFLFMMVSAFSLCCGYYDRIKEGTVNLNQFYKRRYSRILPFFAILVMISVLIPHSPNRTAVARSATQILGNSGLPPFAEKVVEGLTELTLGYGLLPNPWLSVMGAGWFLGVIFLFYMLFPFFVFLIDNKRRAWLSLVIVHLLCLFCTIYFFSPKFISFNAVPRSFLYNAPYFLLGGLIYLYRGAIEKGAEKKGLRWLWLIICVGITVFYWVSRDFLNLKTGYEGVLVKSAVMGAWLVLAVGSSSRVLHNPVIDYLSGISMEIYLCHMMMLRVVGYLHIPNYVHNVHVAYILTCLLTLAVAVGFSHVVKYMVLPKVGTIMNKKQ